MFSPRSFINTDIINIKCIYIRKNVITFYLLMYAEGMTQWYIVFVNAYKNRCSIITQNGF